MPLSQLGSEGMMRRIVLFLGIALSAGAPAQTYKWTDERGVTTYGSKPPAGRPAQLVDTQPRGPVDLTPEQQSRVEAQARRRAADGPPPLASSPELSAAAAEPVRGMGFDTYIRLERGMSEGELLLRAGRPDQLAVDTAAYDVVKSYYYFPTDTDPFITVVTLRGGRIANLERTKKF
jgi:hypothetical protein